jgi:hypothetical protein
LPGSTGGHLTKHSLPSSDMYPMTQSNNSIPCAAVVPNGLTWFTHSFPWSSHGPKPIVNVSPTRWQQFPHR